MDNKLTTYFGNVADPAVPPGPGALGARLDASRGSAPPAAEPITADLLGSVSHELRSPLTIIKGYTATLLRHSDTLEEVERREFLEAIRTACERLEVMVGQLLEMSQLETGALVPAFIPLNPEQLVREAAFSCEERLERGGAGEQRVTLQATGSGHLPLVEADPRLLRSAVDSLLENGLKYSPRGGAIDVRIQTAEVVGLPARPAGKTEETPSPNAVVITVADSGIGIPAEHLERIFDRFHRVDSGLTREVSGLGLGLAICKRIVELHGGSIWGESQLGIGSTFYIALPVAAEKETPAGYGVVPGR